MDELPTEFEAGHQQNVSCCEPCCQPPGNRPQAFPVQDPTMKVVALRRAQLAVVASDAHPRYMYGVLHFKLESARHIDACRPRWWASTTRRRDSASRSSQPGPPRWSSRPFFRLPRNTFDLAGRARSRKDANRSATSCLGWSNNPGRYPLPTNKALPPIPKFRPCDALTDPRSAESWCGQSTTSHFSIGAGCGQRARSTLGELLSPARGR